jgi:DNA-binding NarL/FixJ family response regulator
MIEVLIVDDQELVLNGIKNLIEKSSNIKVKDITTNGNDAINLIKENTYNVILLDISMPYKSGLEVLEEIRIFNKNIPILILSVFQEEIYALRALQLGANGYLTKNASVNELIDAINKVVDGGKYINIKIAEMLAYNYATNPNNPKHQCLTKREFDIFCKIAEGKTLKEISNELNISDRTVSTHRHRILEKMKMNNNAEIIRYALEHKLII